MKTNDFVGITHRFGRSSFKACDCIGLVRLFYREHGWPETFWDNSAPITKKNYHSRKTWKRLIKYLNSNFNKVNQEELRYGDVVLFNIDGDLHLGIYLQYGDILAMQVPVVEGETRSTIYHRNLWSLAYVGGWSRRIQLCQ